jgi:predicted amidohydrolase
MKGIRKVKLAAAQPLSAKARRMKELKDDPAARRDHFLKYNLGASTYDEAYAREYGEDYLPYLEEWVQRAAERKADLLLFPEFCFVPGVLAAPASTIPPNPDAVKDAMRLYEWSGRVFTERLTRWSRETGMLIGAATLTSRGGRLYNTGLLADEKGRIVLRYDKIHLPQDEAVHFTPGRSYEVTDTRLGRIGFSICYDIQFPEAAAALAVLGAQLVLHPSAGYTLPDESPDMGCNRLRVRASDHFTALLYSSFAPVESGGPGGSCAIAPNGDVLDSVSGARTGLAFGETPIGMKRRWPGDEDGAPDREVTRRKFRHPETYGDLARRPRR